MIKASVIYASKCVCLFCSICLHNTSQSSCYISVNLFFLRVFQLEDLALPVASVPPFYSHLKQVSELQSAVSNLKKVVLYFQRSQSESLDSSCSDAAPVDIAAVLKEMKETRDAPKQQEAGSPGGKLDEYPGVPANLEKEVQMLQKKLNKILQWMNDAKKAGGTGKSPKLAGAPDSTKASSSKHGKAPATLTVEAPKVAARTSSMQAERRANSNIDGSIDVGLQAGTGNINFAGRLTEEKK